MSYLCIPSLGRLKFITKFGMFLATSVFFSLTAAASDSQSQSGLVKAVTFDCGQWITTRKAPEKAIKLRGFMQGYVSGLSVGSGIDILGFRGGFISEDQMSYWMDNYCEANPLDTLNKALMKFADEQTYGAYGRWAKGSARGK